MLLQYSRKLFIKLFIKVVSVRHNKWKIFQKHINITTTHPISVTFFSNFLSFDCRVFIIFVFCISSNNCNKLNSISRGICVSFKSSYLELFCKIIIYYLAILQRNFSRVMVKSSTVQLYRTIIFLVQLWMVPSNHLINKCNQKIRQVKN